MMKRFLAWALSCCMLFEAAPMTAYAAEPQTETVMESSTEEPGMEEAGETQTTEETENIETVEASTEETVSSETEEITAEESEEESSTEESTEEITTPETEESSAEETTTAEADTEEGTAEETTEAESVEAESAVETETEEEETEIEVILDSVTENEVMEIVFGTTTSIDVEYGQRNWYSFTAPEAGYYNFYSSGTTSGNWLYLYLYKELDGNSIRYTSLYSSAGNLATDKMEAGETVYLQAYTYADAGESCELEVQKLTTFDFVEQGDGSYIAETDDYRVLLQAEVGYGTLKNTISLEAKEGKTLEGSYKIRCDYNKVGESYSNDRTSSLYSYSNYQATQNINVGSGSTYKLKFTLLDSSSNIIAALAGDITLTTEYTEEAVIIHDIKTAESSITMNIEKIDSNIYECYYAPVNKPEEELSKYIDYWNDYEFTGLQPETEYYFQFTNHSGKVLYETKASTAASTTKIEYTAAFTDSNTIQLKADVSGYTGTASYAYLYYEYTDALGQKQLSSAYKSLSETEKESFSVETDISSVPFLADTTYDVSLWIKFSDDAVLGKEVKQVTAPAAEISAEDITFTAKQNEITSTSLDYSVLAAGSGESLSAYLCYKAQEDKGSYTRRTLPLQKGNEYKQTISGFQNGMTYDLVLFAGGIKKEQTVVFSDGSMKLVQVGEGETNAFDIVRTFKLESTEELTSTYYVQLYYWNENSYERIGTKELTADEEYQTTVKTAEMSQWFTPDKDYQLRWTVSESSYGSPIYTCYETIHTQKADIQTEVAESFYNQQKYTITFSKDDLKNFSSPNFYLYGYIKKTDEASYRNNYQSVYLSESNGHSNSVTFTDLEPSTSYEISWRKDGVEFGTTNFTTPEDTRTIEVTSVDAKLHSADIQYSCTGISSSMNGYVFLYIREKGDENTWEKAGSNSYYSQTGSFYVRQYNNIELKEDTAYEYKAGFGDEYNTKVDKLEKVITGEFHTTKDNRTLSGAGVSTGYTTATMSALFSGNDYNSSSYIYFFYKEKGASNWRKTDSYTYTNASSQNCSQKVTGLKNGTTYDYAIAIADSWDCSSPDEISAESRKTTGEFTTKKCEYTLDFVTAEDKLTNKSAVISVKAGGSTADSRIKVVLTLSDGQEQTVTLKQANDYQKEVTFTNLLGETVYTITKAVISVTEENSFVNIGEIVCNHSFTTKKAEIPTSITLSEEKIALNAAYADEDFKEGYNGVTLKAAAVPGTAAADFVWSSSDENVAIVSDGRVQAVGAGSAVITAASVYDSAIKASCEVTVKDYVIGLTNESGVDIVDNYSDTWWIYKNGSFAGTALYERDSEGNVTPLSDFAVTSSREEIVSCNNGKLIGKETGYSFITLEKDGIKAGFYMEVEQEAKGFGITGFTSSDAGYPAKETEEGYILAYTGGITYRAKGELSPSQSFNSSDFEWSISDTSVATVSDTGVVTPLMPGKTTLKVVPKSFRNMVGEYKQKAVEVVLDIRSLPTEAQSRSLYALANVSKTIADVKIADVLGEGWSWKYPNTPLVINGINKNAYSFEAVYTGTDNYPGEAEISVYIAKITGIAVTENGTDHNQVVEVGGKDTLSLSVRPVYQGTLSSSSYTVETPAVDGLDITKEENGTYTITANKSGTFSIPFVIKAADKQIAKTVYKIKAVEGQQVRSITFTTDTEGVTIDGNKVIFETVEAKKDFTLNAVAADREGKEINTVLQWKSSDKSVADVKTVSKQNTHSAKVSAKAEGHTVITVKAKDAAGYTTELDVEIQNHAPRVDTSKATVNIAYDYDNYNGRNLASAAGCVEIVPAYGEGISSVQLLTEDGSKAEENLKAVSYSGYKYLIQPTKADIATGTYNCTLRVETNVKGTYDYKLKVSVVDKAPTVSAKMSSAVNLFYLTSTGRIDLSISGTDVVESVTWEDASTGVNNGFTMTARTSYNSKKKKYDSYISVSQQDIKMAKGVLEDSSIANGKLSVKVRGYRKTYSFDNFTVKYTYKKPALTTMSANTTVVPSVGSDGNSFYVYNKTDKRYMYYGSSSSIYYYDEVECSSDTVKITPYNNVLRYSYSGSAKSEKITFTVDSVNWRESIQVNHTIKTVQPKAYLSTSQLTFNTAAKSTAGVSIYIKNAYYITSFADVVIKGANDKAQKLLDNDLLTVSWNSGNYVQVKQNQLNIMEASIPNGTYTYKVTPYYENKSTGEKTALNTLNLKVKITNKAVTAKVSPKGSLDLANGTSYSLRNKKNVVVVDPKFVNAGSGYSIDDFKLVGEYSDYFNINSGWDYYGNNYGYHYYITVKESGKLKAKQGYKLAVEYTVTPNDGESFTVTSNTFTIKPKQTTPKITVSNNNQTLYAGADNLSRTYYLSVPSYYSIESVYGSLDCNKDGKADIVVSGGSSLSVRISDRDAVGASAKGKTYSIPVTLRMVGRDGISVDAKVTIKVKVKR